MPHDFYVSPLTLSPLSRFRAEDPKAVRVPRRRCYNCDALYDFDNPPSKCRVCQHGPTLGTNDKGQTEIHPWERGVFADVRAPLTPSE